MSARRGPRAVTLLASMGALAGIAGPGCRLIDPGAPTYLSNDGLLRVIEEEAGFRPDPEIFELSDAEVRPDAVTLHYRGVAHAQDVAWVCRFSPKSSEQDPVALVALERIVPRIAEGRRGFQRGKPAEEALSSARLVFVPYTFDAPIRDQDGRPHPGRGIVGILERELRGERVVYYFNFYNLGDRDSLTREDLDPLVSEMMR